MVALASPRRLSRNRIRCSFYRCYLLFVCTIIIHHKIHPVKPQNCIFRIFVILHKNHQIEREICDNLLYRESGAPGPQARRWKNEGFLPRSVLDVVSRVAPSLIITVVVGEAIHHCVEWGFSHAFKAGRADKDSTFRSHVASSNPKVLVFIVEFAGGGLVNSFHRFYPLSFCVFIIS